MPPFRVFFTDCCHGIAWREGIHVPEDFYCLLNFAQLLKTFLSKFIVPKENQQNKQIREKVLTWKI